MPHSSNCYEPFASGLVWSLQHLSLSQYCYTHLLFNRDQLQRVQSRPIRFTGLSTHRHSQTYPRILVVCSGTVSCRKQSVVLIHSFSQVYFSLNSDKPCQLLLLKNIPVETEPRWWAVSRFLYLEGMVCFFLF